MRSKQPENLPYSGLNETSSQSFMRHVRMISNAKFNSHLKIDLPNLEQLIDDSIPETESPTDLKNKYENFLCGGGA